MDDLFRSWCRDFLDDQIQIMKPRAIIALGRYARLEFKWHKGLVGTRERAGIEFRAAALTHPSAPTYFERMGDGRPRISHEATVLRQVAGI